MLDQKHSLEWTCGTCGNTNQSFGVDLTDDTRTDPDEVFRFCAGSDCINSEWIKIVNTPEAPPVAVEGVQKHKTLKLAITEDGKIILEKDFDLVNPVAVFELKAIGQKENPLTPVLLVRVVPHNDNVPVLVRVGDDSRSCYYKALGIPWDSEEG